MAQTGASRESPEDETEGWRKIQRLFATLDSLPDLSEVPISEDSWFHREAQIQPYDPADAQVLFLVNVARDHLDTLHRGIVDPAGGLPTMAGYTLMRAAIEASCTAIWLQCSGKMNVRLSRSLWMIVHARDTTRLLSIRLGIQNEAGYAHMRNRVEQIIASRRDLKPSLLDRDHKTTSIINEAQRHVPRNDMTPLEAWQACSGIAHGNRSSTLMFLEKYPVETTEKGTSYRITSSATVTAMILELAVSATSVACRIFQEHSRG